ncbi:M81 family metallopeptidase [Oceanibaculum pacificum]|uniref:Microcystinase C n=1 Tax=Oceanibaculum pacificum TaxID=580166 RepID=A0A154VQ76_9PROT|nr:M81 family metallopeptidase [Oceanibaculum pacificum]KZD03389.1 MlrC family protein 3 [Oceanibaculum pacificum]
MSPENPRIAILGFAIECNRFSPVSTAADFAQDVDISGDRIVEEARSANATTLPDLPGFFAEMDRTGPWTPVPLRVALAQPGGPVDQDFFNGFLADIEAGLQQHGPFDGVFVGAHGAALSTGSDDPDGDLFELIRRVVGPDVPVAAVFDLHANISRRMTDNLSVFVGYLQNPHTDIRERGIEAARHMRELLAGAKTAIEMVKLPLVPPSIALLTAPGNPYGEIIAYGQTKLGGDIMNVSVMAGFAFSDTPKNGFTPVVTARNGNREAARALALELAEKTWAMRQRFRKTMTPLKSAVAQAVAAGKGERAPVLLADVADNPGGGGRGNTVYILQALVEAGAEGAVLGVFFDPALAEESHRRGVGQRFTASFNRREETEFSEPYTAEAEVLALVDGPFVGRRGMYQDMAGDLGPAALLKIGGVQVVVITNRQQCLEPMQLEILGVDLSQARCLVVKSRGHFRAGFDEFFTGENILEVDCPGLTSPSLHNFNWTRLPRPVYPMDEQAVWSSESA